MRVDFRRQMTVYSPEGTGREKQTEGGREGRREGPSGMENQREKVQLWLPGEREQLRVLCEMPG